MVKRKPKHYVDNEKFYEAIVEYKKECRKAESEGKEIPIMPDYIASCIMKIATKVATTVHLFRGYSYSEDMASNATLDCYKYFHNFDEINYNNPHTYFTMICYNSNKQMIKNEKKQQYVKYKSFENEMVMFRIQMKINLSVNFQMRDEQKDKADAWLMENDPHYEQDKNVAENGVLGKYDNISEYIGTWEKSDKERKEKRKKALKKKRKMKDLENFMKT